MAKKQKRVKHKRGGTIAAVQVAEPGWRAVYGPCQSCETPMMDVAVDFWVFLAEGVCYGLCRNPRSPGFFYPAPAAQHFVGYARPGELAEDVLKAYAGGH